MALKFVAGALFWALSLPSYARPGDWECAIWLCLTVGFSAPDCHKAKEAMFKRIFEFKSPVPSFDSCEIEGGHASTNHYDYTWAPAALIYPRRYNPEKGGSYSSTPNIDMPPKIVDGISCDALTDEHLSGTPPYTCVANLSAITLLENNLQFSDTYYMNRTRSLFDRSDYMRDQQTGELILVIPYELQAQ